MFLINHTNNHVHAVCSHLHKVKWAIGNEEHLFSMLWQLLQHSVALLSITNVFLWKMRKQRKREGVGDTDIICSNKALLFIGISQSYYDWIIFYVSATIQMWPCNFSYISFKNHIKKSKNITNICLHSSEHNALDVNISNGFLWGGKSKQPSAKKSWLQWHKVSIQLQ